MKSCVNPALGLHHVHLEYGMHQQAVRQVKLVMHTEYLPTAGAKRLLSSLTRSLPPDFKEEESGPAMSLFVIRQALSRANYWLLRQFTSG